MDKDLREAERSGDAVRLLRERVRAGELTQERVELAASLGHAAALELCPEVDRAIDRGEGGRVARTQWIDFLSQSQGLLSTHKWVRTIVDWVSRPAVSSKFGDESAPANAIAAARRWIDCPCEACAHRAEDASEEAWTMASRLPAAQAAPLAAGKAAKAAAESGFGEEAMVDNAAEAAGYALMATGDSEAELDWQTLRLAAYVLGEVDTDEPAV